jgi:quinol monooxygenase YgiN
MITRIVRMRFRPEAIPEFLEIWRESRALIRARPGCLEANLFADDSDPTAFYTLSRWKTGGDLFAYRKSELFGVVWPRTKVLFAAPAEAFSLQAVAD